MDLRKAFFDNLIKLAENDKDIVFLTDDLGFSFIEEFQKKFPKQFINCGVIEQTMTGIAAGLALGGKKPYIYGTTPFVIMRNYEQLRDDIAYQNLNVKIIGYSVSGFVGYTHNLEGLENEEDLLKNLPNLETYYPNDIDVACFKIVGFEEEYYSQAEKKLKKAMLKSYKDKRASYVRI